MRADLLETPETLARLIPRVLDAGDDLLPAARVHRGLGLLARGSSAHMAALAGAALGLAGPALAAVLPPGAVPRSPIPGQLTGYGILAVSQSGRTPEIVEAAGAARAGGAHVLALTNDADSPLARSATTVLDLGAGPERAIPATKTVNAQAVALLMLMAAVRTEAGVGAGATPEAPPTPVAWAALPGAVASLLVESQWQLLTPWRRASSVPRAVLGRGLTTAIAAEGALKLTETCGTPVVGMSAHEYRHGWLAGLRPGDEVLLLAASEAVSAGLDEVSAVLTAQGGTPAVLSPGSALGLAAMGSVADQPWCAAIGLLVRVQQIAWLTALTVGRDPDRPAGLSKVTLTA